MESVGIKPCSHNAILSVRNYGSHGPTVSANVATQEGDHGCYYYRLILCNQISGSIFPIPGNSTQIKLVTVAISSLKYIRRHYLTS